MDGVKSQLLLDGMVELAGASPGSIGTDNDFAMIESNDVGRPFDTHEIDVNFRDHWIADDSDNDLGQLTQGETAIIGKIGTDRQGSLRNAAKPGGVQLNAALAVDEDYRSHAIVAMTDVT